MDIRRAERRDSAQLLELYTQLRGDTLPQLDEKLEVLWSDILEDKNHHVIIGVSEGQIISC